MPARITKLRKADCRYYVTVDGVTVGWVLKNSDRWTMYATVREAMKGEIVGAGQTRNEALWEGLGTLRIRYYGRVFVLNHETWKEDAAYLAEAVLEGAATEVLYRMYPAAGSVGVA